MWFKDLRLSTLLLTIIGIWAVLFYISHGAAVFVYLALHVCTTGVFCFLIFRKMHKMK
jgi:hypothetical protein